MIHELKLGMRVHVSFLNTRRLRVLYRVHLVGTIPASFVGWVDNFPQEKGWVVVQDATSRNTYRVPVEAVTPSFRSLNWDR